jgi:hypothetical protein
MALELPDSLFGARVTRVRFCLALIALFASSVGLAQGPNWRDPSRHQVRFVTVDRDVRLDVLDWGSQGRAVVLLAGLGSTAHDDFAEKLAGLCRFMELRVAGTVPRAGPKLATPRSV